VDYRQAFDILDWWARTADTIVIEGTNGHIFDIVEQPISNRVCERWLGSNVYEAAGAIIAMSYQTTEPTTLTFKAVLCEGAGARKRFQLQ